MTKVPNRKVTQTSVALATKMRDSKIKSVLEAAKNYEADPRRKERLKRSLCIPCFYSMKGRLSGAMVTSCDCGVCEETMVFGSTAVDVLCLPCGNKHGLCVQCGSERGE